MTKQDIFNLNIGYYDGKYDKFILTILKRLADNYNDRNCHIKQLSILEIVECLRRMGLVNNRGLAISFLNRFTRSDYLETLFHIWYFYIFYDKNKYLDGILSDFIYDMVSVNEYIIPFFKNMPLADYFKYYKILDNLNNLKIKYRVFTFESITREANKYEMPIKDTFQMIKTTYLPYR